MNYFRDVSALHDVLGVSYEKAPSETRRAELARLLEEWGFSPDQASLYASSLLCRNAEGSADWVRTNAFHVSGSWVRGEQQGNVGSWLSTMKETWTFNIDLTYEHKIERYESSISTGAVPPILVFTTDGKRSTRHLGSAGLDTRSARFICDVFRWLCTPDEAGMGRQYQLRLPSLLH